MAAPVPPTPSDSDVPDGPAPDAKLDSLPGCGVVGLYWGVVPVAVFLVVTVGLRPTVNLIARLRSPQGSRRYGISGTWFVGLVAAVACVGIEWLLTCRTPREPER